MKEQIKSILQSSSNWMFYDLPGSGKSVNTISAINELDLAPKEVIIWCAYSQKDLEEKQKRFTKKCQIVFSHHNEKGLPTLKEIKRDSQIIMMPIQYYRKFSPIKEIGKRGFTIKKVIIDELSYLDMAVPSLLSKNYLFGQNPEETIKKTFSKIDLLKARERANEDDDRCFWSHFISNNEVSHFVLSTEKLTSLCLKEIGYKILEGDLLCQKDCVLRIWENENVTRDLISYCDFSECWDEFGYDSIFCNASKDDFTTNHTLARGSNAFIGNTTLTVFRRFGNGAEYSTKKILKDLLPQSVDKLLKIYYTDCLTQIVSRTLGYRGQKVGDVITHPNVKKMLATGLFPYKIKWVKSLNKKVEKIVSGCNKTNTDFKDNLIFGKEYRMTTKEMKEISGMPGSKAMKALIAEGYDLQIKKSNGEVFIIGCKGVEK